ncbi:hypothetical protein HDV00_006145 [Rhizophlyctis rosea]|nr:hypothetical protein HDV00_006145 [Rhizophlyctis rosea]
MRSAFKFFGIAALISAAILIPTHWSGGLHLSGLSALTLANVSPSEKKRLWAHLCVSWILCAGCMYTIHHLLRKAAYLRHTFLISEPQRKSVSGYTLLLRDIPRRLRDPEKLRILFNRVQPGSVHAVIVLKDSKTLNDLWRKRRKCLLALEESVHEYLRGVTKEGRAKGWVVEERSGVSNASHGTGGEYEFEAVAKSAEGGPDGPQDGDQKEEQKQDDTHHEQPSEENHSPPSPSAPPDPTQPSTQPHEVIINMPHEALYPPTTHQTPKGGNSPDHTTLHPPPRLPKLTPPTRQPPLDRDSTMYDLDREKSLQGLPQDALPPFTTEDSPHDPNTPTPKPDPDWESEEVVVAVGEGGKGGEVDVGEGDATPKESSPTPKTLLEHPSPHQLPPIKTQPPLFPTHPTPSTPRPSTRPHLLSPYTDTITTHIQTLRHISSLMHRKRTALSRGTGRTIGAAFIVFTDLFSPHVAALANIHGQPGVMSDKSAGVDPSDIIWKNLGMGYEMRVLRWCVATVATVGLTLAWGLITTFISSMASLDKLTKTLPFLNFFNTWNPALKAVIQGVLPTIFVTIVFALIPVIMRFLSEFAGLPTKTAIEQRLITFYFIFLGTVMAQHAFIFVVGMTYCTVAPLALVFVVAYFGFWTVAYGYQMQYVYTHLPETGGLYLHTTTRKLFWGLYIHQLTLVGLFFLKEAIIQGFIMLIAVACTIIFHFHSNLYHPLMGAVPAKAVIDIESKLAAGYEEGKMANNRAARGRSGGEGKENGRSKCANDVGELPTPDQNRFCHNGRGWLDREAARCRVSYTDLCHCSQAGGEVSLSSPNSQSTLADPTDPSRVSPTSAGTLTTLSSNDLSSSASLLRRRAFGQGDASSTTSMFPSLPRFCDLLASRHYAGPPDFAELLSPPAARSGPVRVYVARDPYGIAEGEIRQEVEGADCAIFSTEYATMTVEGKITVQGDACHVFSDLDDVQ